MPVSVELAAGVSLDVAEVFGPFELLRPADLLHMRLTLEGVRVDPQSALRLIPSGGRPVRATVELGPQHLAEETAWWDSGGISQLNVPMKAALSGPTRLRLAPPEGWEAVGRSLEALLDDLQRWSLSRPEGSPDAESSAIELPWRLWLRPAEGCQLQHPSRTEAGVNALWFTRLSGDSLSFAATQEPLQGPSDSPHPLGDTFRGALDADQRRDLVALTAQEPAGCGFIGLSALGAWLEARHTWDAPPDGVDLIEWSHSAAQGRDHAVRTVEQGVLYPSGHAARLVRVSSRVFVDEGGEVVAALASRAKIIVHQALRDHDSHGLPFTRLRFRTRETPWLDDPALPASAVSGASWQEAFWPRVGGDDLRFELELTDHQGRTHRARTPQIFMSESASGLWPLRQRAYDAWRAAPERHALALNGALVAYAAERSPGDTSLSTQRLVLGATDPLNSQIGPKLAVADVRVEALDAFGAGLGEAHVRYPAQWLGSAADREGAGVFLGLCDAAGGALTQRALSLSQEATGGLAALSLSVAGLARRFGPVADLAAFDAGRFDPRALLGSASPLLGRFPLADLIGDELEVQIDGEALPRFVARSNPGLISLSWAPPLKALSVGPVTLKPRASSECRFQADHDRHAGTLDVQGTLRRVDLEVAGLIELGFGRLRFRGGHGGSGLDVEVDGLRLLGPLSFVEALFRAVSIGGEAELEWGVDDGVAWARVRAPVPGMTMGMFEIGGLRFKTQLNLPLDGDDLWADFALSSRDDPFHVAVCGVGGRGWAALSAGCDGPRALDVGLQAGGVFSLNLGVAAGAVWMTVGLAFLHEAGQTELSGLISMGGSVNLMGIASVSISLELAMGWRQRSGKSELFGRASARLEISVLFFSVSVEVDVERALAGSDPSFADQHTLNDWLSYQRAFA